MTGMLASKLVKIPTQAAVSTGTQAAVSPGTQARGGTWLLVPCSWLGTQVVLNSCCWSGPSDSPGWVLALPASCCVALGGFLDLSVLPIVLM